MNKKTPLPENKIEVGPELNLDQLEKMMSDGPLTTHLIVEPEYPIPTAVERMCAALKKQWDQTAGECDDHADALEKCVADLRRRANALRNASANVPQDIKDNVQFELECRERSHYLLTVLKT